MGCHDGSHEAAGGIERPVTPDRTPGWGEENHSVGMNYEESVMRDPLSCAPRTQLDPRIRLVDDRVSCISCHELKAEFRSYLPPTAVSGAASQECMVEHELTVGPETHNLCMACHNI